jgi:predicted nucleotidyltransferase
MDKWKRCEIALNHGVDLVIELPYPFATQSADFFSEGSISLLEALKVEKIIFGSESNDINTLEKIAKVQIENEDFDKLVKIYYKFGKNYPTALSCAIEDLTGEKIDTPNDLLGVSYIKTILKNKYQIKAETIQRTNDYHNTSLEESISSATSIREALKKGESIENQVPKDTLKYYQNLHFMEDYYDLLKYKILTEDHLEKYQTVEEGIEGSLKKAVEKSTNYEELIQNIKSKRYTYNKISRMLLHILCGFTKEKANSMKKISYIRILGFSNKGRDYLNKVKKEVELPMISKINRNKDSMLEFELETTKIYDIKTNDCKAKEESKIIIKGEEND